MKRIYLGFVAALLWGIADLPAYAQSAEDAIRFTQRSPATGARMLGMGGAGIAGIADWNAVYTNPAGLGWLQTSEANGALSHFLVQDRARFQRGDFSQTETTRFSSTGLSNLGYAYKVPTARGSLVIGAGYSRIHSFNRNLTFEGENNINSISDYFMPLPGEFEIDEVNDDLDIFIFRPISHIAFEAYAIDIDLDAYDAGDPVPFFPSVFALPILQGGEVLEEGGMSELNFAGAFEATPGVMMGLSANIVTGRYDYEYTFTEDDFMNVNDGTGGPTDFGFDFLQMTERLSASLFSVGLRGGVSAEVIPNVRLGATIETPTITSINETYSTIVETWFDDGFNAVYGGETGDVGTGEFDYRIVTPWRLGVGGSLTFGMGQVSADLEYVDWSQMRMRADADQAHFDNVNRNLRNDYAGVLNVRLGGELNIADLVLRGGFGYQPDPQVDPVIERDRLFLSAGVGYRFDDRMRMDLGWMNEQFDDRFVPYNLTDAPQVNERVSRNRLLLGLSLFF